MGSHHLRVLLQMPDVEVVAIAEPSEQRRALIASRHPQLNVLASLVDVLTQHEPDFVCLAAPVEDLAELAMQCITARIPVLVEKPLASTLSSASEVVDAAAEADILLAVGYVERCNPAVQALKAHLDRGTIGEVLQLHARRLSPYPGRQALPGVALDLASHDIDVMRHLVDTEVTRVYAETARHVHASAPDQVCATLRFGNDATGLLEVNWITPAKVRQLSVTGTDGMFVVDYLTQDLTLFEHPRAPTEWDALQGLRGTGEGDTLRYALARREPLAVQWELFLGALRNGGPAAVTGEDALATLTTIEAIDQAGRSHHVLRMSPQGRSQDVSAYDS